MTTIEMLLDLHRTLEICPDLQRDPVFLRRLQTASDAANTELLAEAREQLREYRARLAR